MDITWELVAQIGLILLMLIIFSVFIAAVISSALDASSKRQIERFRAGLPVRGWKRVE